jgi:hypothetical protein
MQPICFQGEIYQRCINTKRNPQSIGEFLLKERVIIVPLSHHDQVNLLKDILSNQQTDCCGSVAEYQQLERLIKSLMVNTNVDGNIKSILQDVYQYSQNGVNASDLEQHIQSNRGQLTQWVDDIGQFS